LPQAGRLWERRQVNNIKRRILALESDFKEIKERYFDKPEVFINFRKRVKEIMDEIDSLN